MCHQDGFKPVPTEKCLTCHADINKGSYTLANGKENPHVSIHYLPETVDCNPWHKLSSAVTLSVMEHKTRPAGLSVCRAFFVWKILETKYPGGHDINSGKHCGAG